MFLPTKKAKGVSIFHVSSPFMTDVARCSWPRVQANRWIDEESKVCDLVQKYAVAFLDSVEFMDSQDDYSLVSPYEEVISRRLAIAQIKGLPQEILSNLADNEDPWFEVVQAMKPRGYNCNQRAIPPPCPPLPIDKAWGGNGL